ncbi:hypothetical protein [Sphingomonas sp.]|jgi:hypothetical protein|uniref:hypothetical protein n=1 Tax=Sphingomonas sp. TaxID=28214 RepID=UPI00307E4D84
MRIVGGKDYYDVGAAWGQDESVVFRRPGDRRLSDIQLHGEIGLPFTACSGGLVAREEDTSAARKRARYRYRALEDVMIDGALHRQQQGQVLFCGTLYRGIRLVREGAGREGVTWFWSYASIADFAQARGLSLHEGQEEVGVERRTGAVRRLTTRIDYTTVPLSKWFEPVPTVGQLREALVAAGITIATNDPAVPAPLGEEYMPMPWAVDQPTLGAMDFAKVLDPYTAHQEIAMWVGGVLPASGPAMVEITDDRVKIAKHGFHHPTSFRRGKGE